MNIDLTDREVMKVRESLHLLKDRAIKDHLTGLFPEEIDNIEEINALLEKLRNHKL